MVAGSVMTMTRVVFLPVPITIAATNVSTKADALSMHLVCSTPELVNCREDDDLKLYPCLVACVPSKVVGLVVVLLLVVVVVVCPLKLGFSI